MIYGLHKERAGTLGLERERSGIRITERESREIRVRAREREPVRLGFKKERAVRVGLENEKDLPDHGKRKRDRTRIWIRGRESPEIGLSKRARESDEELEV